MALDFKINFSVHDGELTDLHSYAFTGSERQPGTHADPWSARLERYSITWVGAFDADVLVGFVHACWDGGRHAFLLDTVVAPTHQRRGLGSTMLRLLIDATATAGCTWLHVDHEPHLETFYRAAGFSPTHAGLLHLAP